MQSFGEKKDDDENYVLPFEGLDKGQVIQNVKMFSAAKLKTRDCYFLLTKILYLITAKSESFTRDEATNIFFAVTKLFQSKDAALRRMMYLLLKELSGLAQDTIIAFAMLIKDVNSDVNMYQANAMRVIAGIMDTAMLNQMERYLKQAIVAKDAYVASSAVVSSFHLAERGSVDVIKRWVTEVQEALKSGSAMLQYHALGLLHKIKLGDRLAISKLVKTYTSNANSLRSPLAHVLLTRFALQVMTEEKERDSALFRFLEQGLRHKSELVAFEAAKTITLLPHVSEAELTGAIAVLQLFLSSPKAPLRYASARILNTIASSHPAAIGTSCSYELENLISDSNRSVATLAITTLLKIESESRVDRLMKQIGNFISDISDEFKVVVVDAIRTLSLKFPAKYAAIMVFLSTMLRDPGGLDFKSAIVNTILSIIERVPEAKEAGLDNLCEFIEDCEHSALTKQILIFLGEEGPKTKNPTRFIRAIYNRVILENPAVRAAAVTALGKFGLLTAGLRDQILVLLARCQHDVDDEVRDRATFALGLLRGPDEDAIQKARRLFLEPLEVPLENLEAALIGYLDAPSTEPFNLAAVPKEVRKPRPTDGKGLGAASALGAGGPTLNTHSAEAAAAEAATQKLAKQMAQLQTLFGRFGKVLNTSVAVELTEAETAYQVTLVKHLFERHVVFQYNVTNTLKEQLLKSVSVDLSSDGDGGYLVRKVFPAPELAYQDTVQVYAALERPPAEPDAPVAARQSFYNNLKFKIHEVDAGSGEAADEGFADEYPLDDATLLPADFVRAGGGGAAGGGWQAAWEQLGEAQQVVTTFGISTAGSVQEGVHAMLKALGMAAHDGSELVEEGKTKHVLLASGSWADTGQAVLARLRMRLVPNQGCAVELAVRSEAASVAHALAHVLLT